MDEIGFDAMLAGNGRRTDEFTGGLVEGDADRIKPSPLDDPTVGGSQDLGDRHTDVLSYRKIHREALFHLRTLVDGERQECLEEGRMKGT